MQYLIHDLLKLPLEDRLVVLEKILCSLMPSDNMEQLSLQIEQALNLNNKQFSTLNP